MGFLGGRPAFMGFAPNPRPLGQAHTDHLKKAFSCWRSAHVHSLCSVDLSAHPFTFGYVLLIWFNENVFLNFV